MPTIVGLDLGTANTVGAYRAEDELDTLIVNPNDGTTNQGNVFPSYVEFNLSGKPIHVGKLAWQDAAGGSTTIVWGSKRLIGLPFIEAERELKYLHFPIGRTPDGNVQINVGSEHYTPEDIAALILQKVKEDAQNSDANPLMGDINQVIVSHPAKFDPDRIKAIRETAEKVFEGIKVTPVPEPVAAAKAYGVQFPPQSPAIITVIDWGAGTLDVVTAVLSINPDGSVYMSPDPAQGKANLGGLDMDELLMDWAIEESGFHELENLRRQEVASGVRAGLSLRDLRETRRKLEDTKIHLSDRTLPQSCEVISQGRRKELTITRENLEEILERPLSQERLRQILDLDKELKDEKFEEWLEERMNTLKTLCSSRANVSYSLPSFLDVFRLVVIDSLKLAGYNPPFEGIEHVILVGGPMKMPCVRAAVREIFSGNENVRVELERIEEEGFPVDPMECVARGAALCGGTIGPPPPPLCCDYLIPLRRIPGDSLDAKPVYIYKDEMLHIGDIPGTKKTSERSDELGGGGHTEVEIVLLEGQQTPGVSSDYDKRKWFRKGYYHFYPTYNSRGEASYIITLQYDENDNSIKCTCLDRESGQDYTYHGLDQKDGEEITLTTQKNGHGMTRELIEQLDLFAPAVNIKADVWLTQKHEQQREQHRPEIEKLKGELAVAHAVAPRPDSIKWEKNKDGDEETRDPKIIRAWGTVYAIAVKLDSFWPETVTDLDVQQAHNRAQFLFGKVASVVEHSGIPDDRKSKVKTESQALEKALRYLPESFPVGYSEKLEDVARHKEVKTRCETLWAAIEWASSGVIFSE